MVAFVHPATEKGSYRRLGFQLAFILGNGASGIPYSRKLRGASMYLLAPQQPTALARFGSLSIRPVIRLA
jgi:hypothetical protein